MGLLVGHLKTAPDAVVNVQIQRGDLSLVGPIPVTEAELSVLHAPVGLDIGADEPGEIAVSILAEIVAERRGAGPAVASISDRDGAIHPDQPPGSAYCPNG